MIGVMLIVVTVALTFGLALFMPASWGDAQDPYEDR